MRDMVFVIINFNVFLYSVFPISSPSKVVSLFMDTLQFFIKEYNPLLRDWLYTLLIRLLYRQSHEALSSHQKAIQETLFVLRLVTFHVYEFASIRPLHVSPSVL